MPAARYRKHLCVHHETESSNFPVRSNKIDVLVIDRPTLEGGKVPTLVKISSMVCADCCTACILPLSTVSLVHICLGGLPY
jgi:hypothetical protein